MKREDWSLLNDLSNLEEVFVFPCFLPRISGLALEKPAERAIVEVESLFVKLWGERLEVNLIPGVALPRISFAELYLLPRMKIK